MSNQDLSRKQRVLHQDENGGNIVWCYEDVIGLEMFNSNGRVGVIPWRYVRASLKRKDRKRKAKR